MFTKRPMADISIERNTARLMYPAIATLAAVTSLGNEQDSIKLWQIKLEAFLCRITTSAITFITSHAEVTVGALLFWNGKH